MGKTPLPEPKGHEQQHRRGRAFRALRSLDGVVSLRLVGLRLRAKGLSLSSEG